MVHIRFFLFVIYMCYIFLITYYYYNIFCSTFETIYLFYFSYNFLLTTRNNLGSYYYIILDPCVCILCCSYDIFSHPSFSPLYIQFI